VGDIYSGDESARETERARREQNEKKLAAAAETMKLLGLQEEVDPSFGERVKRTVTGSAKSYAGAMAGAIGAYTDAAGRLSEAAANATNNSGRVRAAERDAERARSLAASAANAQRKEQLERQADRAERKVKALTPLEVDSDSTNAIAQNLYKNEDNLSNSAAQDLERAQQGLGTPGRLAVAGAGAALQMGADIGLGALTGLGNMVPMMVRSFGGGAQEARRKGYSHNQQMLMGLSTAATEYFTEKLFGGNPVYDADAGLVNRLVDKVVKNDSVKRWVNTLSDSVLSEGLEEMISDVLEPVAEWAITGNSPEYELDQIIEDGIVGVMVGAIGKGVNLALPSVTARQNEQTARELALPTPGSIEAGNDSGAANEGAEAQKNAASNDESENTPNAVAATLDLPNPTERVETERNETSVVQHVQRAIPSMQNDTPVAILKGTEIPVGDRVVDRLVSFANSIGNKVHRKGFGDVLLSKSRIKNAMIGHGFSKAKVDTFAAVPAVIRNGVQIGHETNWKGRGYETFLFAAPVEYRGDRSYVGVVVSKDATDGRYYVHEVVDGNGNVLLGEEKTQGMPSDGRASLAGTVDTVASPVISDNTIPQASNVVNRSLDLQTPENSQTIGNLDNGGGHNSDEQRRRQGVPPDGMDIDEYTARLEAKAKEAKRERLREKSREDYVGSPSLNALGVKIAESVGEYATVDQLVAQAKAARKTKRAIASAERRLNPSPAEKDFANGIAAGIYTLDDIPKSMSDSVVSELVDYYTARNAANEKLLGRVKKRIYQNIEEKLDSIFGGEIPVAKKRPNALTINYRTAQRNMRAIFGDQTGDKLNKYLFDAVDANESERIRFVNKQFDAVRSFKDSSGHTRRLTDAERQVAQMILEGVNPGEIVAGVEIMTALENAAIAAGQDSAQATGPYVARWEKAAEKLRSGEADLTIVNHAVEAYQSLYAKYYDAINDFLAAHGYEPVGWRANYAPHMQPQETKSALQTALNGLGINTEVTNLPTDIAGLTAAYRPNKRFDPHFLERQGHLTDFDVEKGFSEYVDYMSDVFYHTDDIMKLRRFSDYIRMAFTREEVGEELRGLMQSRYTAETEEKLKILRANDAIDKDTVLSDADAEQRFDRYVSDELERYGTNYGDFVAWLDNYTNILAGKQSFADRGAESIAGRKLLNAGRRMISTFSNSKVAGNLSSTLNQTAQLPFILSEIGAKNTIRAIRDIAGKGRLGYFKTQSDFLTGKRGIDYLVQTDGQKIMNVLFTPVSLVDEALSTIAVRGKYLQALDAGKTADEAMRLADRYGKEVMASRLKGARPVAFNSKNPVHQAINIFQLEALGSWEHLTQDKFGRDFREVEKEKGKSAAAAQAGAYLAKTVMSAFILNRIAEAVYGGTPAALDLLGLVVSGLASGEGEAPNDWLMEVLDNGWEQLFGERIFNTEPNGEKEFDYKEAAKNFAYNLSNDIPFLRNVSGVLGVGDQTLPIPNVAGGLRDVASSVADNGVFSGETAKAAGSLVSELLPVGGQAKKTGLGIEYLARGGDFSGYGENARLKYPADERWTEAVKAVLFGKNTTTAAKRYYASDNTALSAKQTKAWKELKADGVDSTELYNLILDYREIGSDKELNSVERGIYQREVIRNSSLTDKQKLMLYSSLTDSESRSEKFQRMSQGGMTFSQITEFYDKWADADASKKGAEATKAKYDLLLDLNFPDDALQTTYKVFYHGEQKEINQLIFRGVSIRNLIQYRAQTADLTADKDSNGKTVSGSLKAKEMVVIDALPLTTSAKDALYLATGHTESTLEDAPWHESPLSKLALPGVSLPSLTLPTLHLPRS